MTKKLLFLIVAMACTIVMGGCQREKEVKCHVRVQIMTDQYGDDVVICKDGTDLRVNDDSSLHHKAVDGIVECDIETEWPEMYEIVLSKQMDGGWWYSAKFIAENGIVNVEMYDNKAPKVESTGKEGKLHQEMQHIIDERIWNPVNEIDSLLETDKERFYQPEFLSAWEVVKNADFEDLPDSIKEKWEYYTKNEQAQYTDEGWILSQRRDSLTRGIRPFQLEYYTAHPMLWTCYDVLRSAVLLSTEKAYKDFNPEPHEQMLSLYETKLSNLYPGHPIHHQIATALNALKLQPGQPYPDYQVRDTDGKLVMISSLTKGKVALIDLWASWCGPCRRHSKAMIPVYEKYKDKGFTIIAIAREQKAEDMQQALEQDGYPWPSLLELNDENHVWELNGAGNAGGAMFLIDRDGTILSTSNDAEELEPIIKAAIERE